MVADLDKCDMPRFAFYMQRVPQEESELMSSFSRNFHSAVQSADWTRRGQRWLIAPLMLLTASTLLVASSAGPSLAADADHLLLSEIVTRTRVISGGRLGSEFIEVVNPTGSAIDMSNVYLTDGTFATSGTFYWNIADGVPNSTTAGGGTFNDFHVRFPDGYMLAAGDTLSISVSGSNEYVEAYGQLPDFELFEDANAPDTVPELVNVFPQSVQRGNPLGEANTTLLPSLSDNSESLILYSWDGVTDLVQDLDFAFWGASAAVLFDKTGVTVGAGTYLADTATGSQETISTTVQNFGQSYVRLSADEGTEAAAGGNGIRGLGETSGHDETSENSGTTWETAASQSPPQAPATHFVTAPILRSGGFNPAAPYDGQEVSLSIDAVSNSALTTATFSYSIDGAVPVDLPGVDQGAGVYTATLPAQVEGAVVAWSATVSNADGASATWPAAGGQFTESWTVGAEPVAGEGPDKLLISEIATLGSDNEFIEIYNPNNVDVDMTDYYLTDANHGPSTQYYYRIAEGGDISTKVGGGAFNDFHSRFPAGFTIAAGDTIVVTVAGSAAFSATYGFLPDLELWEDDVFPDNVPDMLWVFGDASANSIVGESTPTLTNGVETVIFYHWDGITDFVTDIDIFNWRDAPGASESSMFDKSGVTVGSHTYFPDTPISQQERFTGSVDFGMSYHRIDAGEGTQTTTGSNGVGGRNETSENLQTTFELAEYDPSRPGGGAGGGPGSGGVELIVEAKTFLPKMGEIFPIRFVSRPQSETKVRLFDQKGRLIITLFDSRFNGPPSTIPDAPSVVVWDGRDEFFQDVRAGMYIAHLSVVNSATGEEDIKIAPVVVATRLSK
ncbi:MAG: hypothetical protein ACI8S7_001689 [Candidatus Krumholzibacteriia bacterium]|jgi:hypothetical protein